jgi:7-keto-8-aminopelargonate synthetase-like enzyme
MKGYYGKGSKVSAERAQSFTFNPDPVTATQAQEALKKMKSFRQRREAHPHHSAFMDAAKRFEDSVRGGNYGE